MKTGILRLATLLLFGPVWLLACTTTHDVRPLPVFVKAALSVGDKVDVVTIEDARHSFVLTDVGDETISGESQTFHLQQIKVLAKHAVDEPALPCGDGEPFNCSVPQTLSDLTDQAEHFSSMFHEACVQHDYCYRHGARTYDYDQNHCDQEFLANMLDVCPPAAVDLIGSALSFLNDDTENTLSCVAVANAFHQGVRRFGATHFRDEHSSSCEYEGPLEWRQNGALNLK
ncbi:MAG: hypothetical protein AB8G16_01645 [Gammaproteobacteria bacterium]